MKATFIRIDRWLQKSYNIGKDIVKSSPCNLQINYNLIELNYVVVDAGINIDHMTIGIFYPGAKKLIMCQVSCLITHSHGVVH